VASGFELFFADAELEDASKYLEELRRELEHSYNQLDILERKRCREMGRLSNSSLELGMPLSPRVEYYEVADEENDMDIVRKIKVRCNALISPIHLA